MNTLGCPVCLHPRGMGAARTSIVGRGVCKVCGTYTYHLSSVTDLTELQRATLSHRIRTMFDSNRGRGEVDVPPELVLSIVSGQTRLPTAAEQAKNVIRAIGDDVSATGHDLADLDEAFHAIIGAPNPKRAQALVRELVERKDISVPPDVRRGEPLRNMNLTLGGWEKYEAEKRGKVEGDYGFIAMQFNDPELDPFVEEVIKPTVREATGDALLDMRDVGEAGVIDNIMRVRIRNARFVLVDLTHDNNGAYWEAGYAEGLGKPVIYLCEKEKFDKHKTHFDTNHCTTIPWSLEMTRPAFVGS